VGYDCTVQTTVRDEAETRALGASLGRDWSVGDVVLLSGPLGAGKTTLVRGYLASLGWLEPVRSPTFSILAEYATDPPVVHADLYRLDSATGLGLAEAADGAVLLIEWPERLGDSVDPGHCWQVDIAFSDEGRTVTVRPPDR
jgi:tRNA threonylcarbamoyladenosine biosynthesis protein TsaE